MVGNVRKVKCPKCQQQVFNLEVCNEAHGKIMCGGCSEQVAYEQWLEANEVASDMMNGGM